MNGTVRWAVDIPMRDGALLAADVFLPDGVQWDGPGTPTIVVRTPYGRQTDGSIEQARYLASRGYAVVNADVRGRGDSEGVFVPYRNEGKDGYDTIEWAAAQSWSNGSIGTVGGSYLAKIQWLTALEQPPHLAAMVSRVAPSDPFVEWPTGTAVPSHLCWLVLTSGRVVQNTHAIDWDEVYQHLPLLTMDEASGRVTPMWREEFRHTHLDDWWKAVCYQTRFAELDVPVLHVSGWYDDEQIGTPLNYMGMVKHARSETARKAQRLIMGPWGHHVNESQRMGAVDFGPQSLIDLRSMECDFLDRWLKPAAKRNGASNALDNDPPVRLFVMGTNEWRDESAWPPAAMEPTPWYFHADGSLSPERPHASESSSTYDYDPLHPTPFITEPTSEQIGGADDYRDIHRRDDLLLFTSAVLDQPLELTGPIQVELHAKSTASDTDFMAQLHDVWPDGFVQRLCDGMVRVRFRYGMEQPELLSPGTIEKLTIDCWNTSHVFLPGHRIRIHVASAAFPKYDRNLNTGEPLGHTVESAVATQTVYHDAARPSCVILPVMPTP